MVKKKAEKNGKGYNRRCLERFNTIICHKIIPYRCAVEIVISEEVRKAVQAIIDAGFNVSPGVIEILSKAENPIEIAKSILQK